MKRPVRLVIFEIFQFKRLQSMRLKALLLSV